MGDHDGERCEFGVDIRGSRNVFEGEVWSNENFAAPGQSNVLDVLTLGTGCTPDPKHLGDNTVKKLNHSDPRPANDWPVTPPPVISIDGKPCIEGGKIASTRTPDQTWLRNNPPGVYCSPDATRGFSLGSNADKGGENLNFAGYTWVAKTISMSGNGNRFSPAAGSRLLLYATDGDISSGPKIGFTGHMLAPKGTIDVPGGDAQAQEGYVQALWIKFTGNDTTFKGTGPYGTPVEETYTETVTVPGVVEVSLVD